MFVGAGSRHEDLESSGSAYLLEKMLLRGTSGKSKQDLSQEIENMGGIYSSDTGREQSNLGLRVMKGDSDNAVRILGDMVSNSTLNAQELELVKEEVSQEHEDNHHRY